MATFFRCPFCGKTLRVSERLSGKVANCPNCKQLITIPSIGIDHPNIIESTPQQVPASSSIPAKSSPPTLPPSTETQNDWPPPFLDSPIPRRTSDKKGFLKRICLLPGWIITLLLVLATSLIVGCVAFIVGWNSHTSGMSKTPESSPIQHVSKTSKTPNISEKKPPVITDESIVQKIDGNEQAVEHQKEKHQTVQSAKNVEDSTKQKPINFEPAPVISGPETINLADLVEKIEKSAVQLNVSGPRGSFTGSGFVLDKQGNVVTNYHVIEGATAGKIVFSDKSEVPIAGYLSVWPKKDIAILRVNCSVEKLYPLSLATSPPRQGDRVATFGSPLGLSRSISEGIVGAIRQSEELRIIVPIEMEAELIQTTAPISHGNSGGPLVNMKGEVVGINTLTFASLGGQNLNFAVSAKDVDTAFRESGDRVLPLPSPETRPEVAGSPQPRETIRSIQPPIVDLTGDPSARTFLKEVRKVALLVNLSGTAATVGVEDAVRASVESAFRGSDLELVKDISPTAAAMFVDIDLAFLNANQRKDKSQNILIFSIKAVLCQRQILNDGTVQIAILWRDSLGGQTLFQFASGELKKRGEVLFRKLPLGHARPKPLPSDQPRPIDPQVEEAKAQGIVNMAKGAAPSNPKLAQDLLWKVIRELSRTKAAQEAWQLLGESDIESYTELIRKNPKNADAYYHRACAHSIADDLDLAIADYTEAIRLEPKYTYAYTGRGEAYYLKKKSDEAITDLTEAIRLDPKSAFAYLLRGFAYDQKEETDNAIADYTEVIRLDPKVAPAYCSRGKAYARRNEVDKAFDDFSETIRLDPKYARAYSCRGLLYCIKQEGDKAIIDFTEAIKLDSKNAPYFERGEVYMMKEKWDKAIADYTDAIKFDPQNADAYFGRGSAYFVTLETDKAISDFSETVRLDPKNARAYVIRGKGYEEKGERDKAIADYSQAIQLDQKNARFYFERGEVYKQKGDMDKADKDFSKAKELGYEP